MQLGRSGGDPVSDGKALWHESRRKGFGIDAFDAIKSLGLCFGSGQDIPTPTKELALEQED